MLFENILLILVCAVITALMLHTYRIGFRDGRVTHDKNTVNPEIPSAPENKTHSEENDEAARLAAISANIDAYDGTAKGQRAIKK